MSVNVKAIAARLRDSEDGFTMILAVITMMISAVLVAAALSSASGDFHLINNDLNQKKAYYAAQAGISDYAFHLNQDVNFWTYCTNVPAPTAVNQVGSTAKRRSVPGSASETYAIELLPATGQSACSTADPIGTMIEPTGSASGTFRIRSTGYACPAGGYTGTVCTNPVQRSIVATFRRRSFVDFIYYTIYETLDPSAYSSSSDRTAAATACHIFWRDGRQPPTSGRNYCSQIFFASGDYDQGPAPHRGSARDLRHRRRSDATLRTRSRSSRHRRATPTRATPGVRTTRTSSAPTRPGRTASSRPRRTPSSNRSRPRPTNSRVRRTSPSTARA